MREALARADHDYVIAEPRRRQPSRGFFANAADRGSRAIHRAAKYTSLIAGAALAAVVVGILVNALALQKARHPAPFFGHSFPLPEAAPAPVPRPAESSAAAVEPAAPARAPESSDARPADQKPAPRDPIAQMLKGVTPPPRPAAAPALQPPKVVPIKADPITAELARAEKTEAAKAEPTRTVAGAQRALVKLGFVLRADGVMGASTREAIEQFERDRHLPPHGELTPRVLHELATQSGVTID